MCFAPNGAVNICGSGYRLSHADHPSVARSAVRRWQGETKVCGGTHAISHKPATILMSRESKSFSTPHVKTLKVLQNPRDISDKPTSSRETGSDEFPRLGQRGRLGLFPPHLQVSAVGRWGFPFPDCDLWQYGQVILTVRRGYLCTFPLTYCLGQKTCLPI